MKVVSTEEAIRLIPNRATIMVGGVVGVGTPELLVDGLVRQSKSGLTLISNDGAVPGRGVGKLFDAGLVSAMTASQIELNPIVQELIIAEKIDIDLVPQRILVVCSR